MDWSFVCMSYHNEFRKDNIPPFTFDQELTKNAFKTASLLAKEDSLYHRDVPDNGLQNIAQGYLNWLEKPQKCVDLWLKDELHAHPILSKLYTKIGVGYGYNEKSKKIYIVANYK